MNNDNNSEDELARLLKRPSYKDMNEIWKLDSKKNFRPRIELEEFFKEHHWTINEFANEFFKRI